MLVKQHADLVQQTWRRLQPMAGQTVAMFYDRMFNLDIIQAAYNTGYMSALFYSRLFELDPELRYLFGNDMRSQGRKFIETISLIVNGLSRVEGLADTLRRLGARHARYGVQDTHYETMRLALLWTLAQSLGDEFTPDVKVAWNQTYAVLTQYMREGRVAT